MAVIVQRHRPRALLAATISASMVAFIAGGLTVSLGVISCAVLGGIVGDVKRRKRGLPTVLVYSIAAGLASALASIALLLILASSRELFFATVRNTAAGLRKLASRAQFLRPAADWFEGMVAGILHYWWFWLGVSVCISVIVGAVFSWFILGAVLDRLAWLPATDRLDAPPDPRSVDPVPVRLTDVSYRYPGARAEALQNIDLAICPGEFVAVVGHNGSGKSTLARILAGRPPTTGTADRPGSAGLGQRGGTAVILQRPESQILGVLVADDVVWGLPKSQHVDVAAKLAEVGLAGLEARETNSLSGGQQQRLAVAAALAREPRLLIADEATSMVDPAGRNDLVALLADLPKRHQMAVVLITHQESEAAEADRVVHLQAGRIVPQVPEWVQPAISPVPDHPPGPPLLQLSGVRHTYLEGTPWATEALHGIDLTVNRGDAVLIVGGNGSGKSTLAWLMAGLMAPSSGTCELDGKPTTSQVGQVGLAFQHSRLQLHRATVGAEIRSWGGPSVGSGGVGRALDSVGLDRAMAGRSIDELSGGQARRLLLAAILASKPRLMVLDEPLAGLDPRGRREIIELLAQLRRRGFTIVVISHDTEGADVLCNRIIRLADGRIAQPDLVGGGPR
ncbi:ATP-binding cassette domain-containing protein [Skermania sp. ID1734]|nr:ATP-binding cassette domain-containing protein [Skermania sp. ID1734]